MLASASLRLPAARLFRAPSVVARPPSLRYAVRAFATAAEVEHHQISRTVQRTRYAEKEEAGTGAVVRAALRPRDGQSPFLVLDFAKLPRDSGFPDHPHRGLTTVTQILDGQWAHEDFLGNSGTMNAGDVQWMTAGRGIVHSEMPEFDGPDAQDPVALQLWVDLPAEDKMIEPCYEGLSKSDIPTVSPTDGVEIGVISGESHGVVMNKRPPALGGTWWLDMTFTKGGVKVWQPIPEGWTALIYVIEGDIQVHEGAPVDDHNTIILTHNTSENGVLLRLPENTPRARIALFAGAPLDQVAFTRGPFVMTNREDAVAAVDDFLNARNGFENAKGWKSKIGKGGRITFPKIGIN